MHKIIPCSIRLTCLDSPSSQSARRMQPSANVASVPSESLVHNLQTETEQPEQPTEVADMIVEEWPTDIAEEEIIENSENSYRALYSPMFEDGIAEELQRQLGEAEQNAAYEEFDPAQDGPPEINGKVL